MNSSKNKLNRKISRLLIFAKHIRSICFDQIILFIKLWIDDRVICTHGLNIFKKTNSSYFNLKIYQDLK